MSVDRITEGEPDAPALPDQAARVLADQLGEQHQWIMLGAEFALRAVHRDPRAREALSAAIRSAQRRVLAASLREHAAVLGLPAGVSSDRAAVALLVGGAERPGRGVRAASQDVLYPEDLIAVLTHVHRTDRGGRRGGGDLSRRRWFGARDVTACGRRTFAVITDRHVSWSVDLLLRSGLCDARRRETPPGRNAERTRRPKSRSGGSGADPRSGQTSKNDQGRAEQHVCDRQDGRQAVQGRRG